MITAAAYILNVPENRRQILLGGPFPAFREEEKPVAEPVPRFSHSRRAPLIVLCSFTDGYVTHIASGRKGASAGTDLVRLNMREMAELSRPIAFSELLSRALPRVRSHLDRTLSSGGLLSPKSLGTVIDALLALQPDLSERLARYSERRAQALAALSTSQRENLALQKETLTTALEIAGFGTEEVLAWTPGERVQRSFLEGMPGAYVREDAAVIADFADMPGFDAIKSFPFAAKLFQSASDPSVRLKVVMANHLPLELQTGADLIYYNEMFRSFLMVQYKSMDRGSDGPEFRWRENDQLAEEIRRMDSILSELHKLPEDQSPGSFRLHSNPFFIKFCPRVLLNPDDKGLFPGMYLPLDLWKCLAGSSETEGARGGKILTYRNAGRKLTNSEFITLVSNAWVGTTIPQSVVLEKVIESVLQTGKTVTFAVKVRVPQEYEDGNQGQPLDFDDFL